MKLGELLSVIVDGQYATLFVGNEELWWGRVEEMPNMWDDLEVCSVGGTFDDELRVEIKHG